MRNMVSLALALVLVPTALVAKDSGEAKVAVTAIETRFVYEKSGALSENIAPPSTFHAWNTMIGEGDAKEPANDLVIIATLKSEPAEANIAEPLSITLVNDRGRVIAKRKISSVFAKGGQVSRVLFVPDAACLGKVAIKVAIGASRRVANLNLNCGE